jgi:GLPGLI family protein
MRKTIVIILMSISKLFAQNQSFHVLYSIQYDLVSMKKYAEEQHKKAPNFDNSIDNLVFEIMDYKQKNAKLNLIFHESKSVCFYEGKLSSDAFSEFQKNYYIGMLELVYYTDLTTVNNYEFYPLHNKNFLIAQEKIEWVVTTETKDINAIKCFKAYNKNNPKNEIWFTYDLPYGVGPLKYFGAPGLILEVKINDTLITAESISFKNVKTDKAKIPKGEIVTKQEMDNIAKKARQAQYGRQ